jgi:hypothetical protein
MSRYQDEAFAHSSGVIYYLLVFLGTTLPTSGEWVTRDKRWQPRGPWNWALPRELPKLFREFNGIDFGHAHLAETLLRTHHPQQVEQARLEVLDFISSSPPVPPDDEQVAPTLVRMAWEVQGVFNWAHTFHRSLYDLFASDGVQDKEAAYRAILASYLEKPEAITPHRLDHHGRLWSFPESKSFDGRRGPQFSGHFPEAAAIFDNLHMLHDNIDDVLSRPDLYPTLKAKREAILRIVPIYLHHNHEPQDHYAEYHGMTMVGHATRGTGQSCFILLWVRNCPLAK